MQWPQHEESIQAVNPATDSNRLSSEQGGSVQNTDPQSNPGRGQSKKKNSPRQKSKTREITSKRETGSKHRQTNNTQNHFDMLADISSH